MATHFAYNNYWKIYARAKESPCPHRFLEWILITLTRAGAETVEVWPVQLADRLPVVAVPLRAPDPDVSLDLDAILATIYDQAGYDLSLDYRQPPPPPTFDHPANVWIDQVLSAYRQSS